MSSDEPADVTPDEGFKADPELKRKSRALGIWDWTNRTISIVAILISLATAYFTVIRRVDRLSVYIPSFPLPYIDDDSGQLGMTNLEQQLTFINPGTESVAVLAEAAGVMDSSSPDCATSVFYDTTPIVVKSGEIAVKQLDELKESSVWKPGKPLPWGTTRLLDKRYSSSQIGDEITVCMFIWLVTSGNVTSRVALPLYKTKLEKLSKLTIGDLVRSDTSLPVIYHYGTIFN
jgi:hypothetical protein